MVQEKQLPTWKKRFGDGWFHEIKEELERPYFLQILQFLKQEKVAGKIIYPPAEQAFNAFYLTPFEQLKVVILGQDPYHGYQQAHGLSFSVQQGIALPPSLQNIFKELKTDLNIDRGQNGCLTDWARQGVLLLNASLTVEESRPMSHQKIGWQQFTDFVIQKISDDKEHVVFILWGRFAGQKAGLIDQEKHVVLKSPHPSPLSAHRGFFGSRPFSKTNECLQKFNLTTINW